MRKQRGPNLDARILEGYNEGLSPYQLAEKFNIYPQYIRRRLKAMGATIRNRSESQKLCMEQGRRPPPMKGKKHSPETKIAISEKVAAKWAALTPEELEQRVERSKKQWEDMPAEKREQMRKSGAQGMRAAADKGSKLENWLVSQLRNDGYDTYWHFDDLIRNEKMQIDIFLPGIGTAIELDGPTHVTPIFGEENFEKVKKADGIKNGLLLERGYNVIRVRNMNKKTSKKLQRDIWEAVSRAIKQVEGQKSQYLELNF